VSETSAALRLTVRYISAGSLEPYSPGNWKVKTIIDIKNNSLYPPENKKNSFQNLVTLLAHKKQMGFSLIMFIRFICYAMFSVVDTVKFV